MVYENSDWSSKYDFRAQIRKNYYHVMHVDIKMLYTSSSIMYI